MNNATVLLKIYGKVQGVGFRPYIYNTALLYKLAGYIKNTSFGAEVLITGNKKNTENFISKIKNDKKHLINISDIRVKRLKTPKMQYKNFFIHKSSKRQNITAEFPSDIALCSDCKKELFSAKDRRYKYSFINCTKCGPRYSIANSLPYDRHNTTMRSFIMCKDCSKEYENIKDRRFHAQPNACYKCGPDVVFYGKRKEKLFSGTDAVKKTAEMIDNGKILAIKSIGGYHLVCDAYNKKAVAGIRKIKNRDAKPFAVMAKNILSAKQKAEINKFEQKELLSQAAPIVLLNKKAKIHPVFNDAVSKDNKYIGIMLPYTPLHYLLFDFLKTDMLVMTSANKSDEFIIYRENEIFDAFGGKIDGFLVNDREIVNPSDDSVVMFPYKNNRIIIRRSRGFVPESIDIKICKNILAAGSELKNYFCMTRKNKAFLSHCLGDMTYYGNIKLLDKSINKFKTFLDVNPVKFVCDLHPNYNTSNYFIEKFKNTAKVYQAQHHFSHMASVLAENRFYGRAIGFSFDGTGYGLDGQIWGSECILFDKKKFKRISHFEYFDLPGGDIAVKEIWRTAVALLYKYNKLEYVPKHIKKEKNYKAVLETLKSFNNAKVCSAGRFIDAVTALTGLRKNAGYEGQAAMHFESVIKSANKEYYDFDIVKNKNNTYAVLLEKIIMSVLKDMRDLRDIPYISSKIHETISIIIHKQAVLFSEIYDIKTIVLSGGVFQNKYIMARSLEMLQKSGFTVLYNKLVPINDGGIALGQIYQTATTSCIKIH